MFYVFGWCITFHALRVFVLSLIMFCMNSETLETRTLETRICIVCGASVTRTPELFTRSPEKTTCGRRCAGKLGGLHPKPSLRGNKKINVAGYWAIPLHQLTPQERIWVGDPGNSFVLEHRLVMMRHLKRPLLPGEVVRHLNGNKQDNDISNLAIGSQADNAMDNTELKIEAEKWRVLCLAAWRLYIGAQKSPNTKATI